MALARKRSEKCHLAILEAASAVLEERGYLGLTIEDVAKRAGCGKQTIYRWWGGKAELTLETWLARSEHQELPETGCIEQDLRAFVRALSDRLEDPALTAAVGGMMAEAQRNEGFAERFQERFLEPKRRALTELFERAVSAGQLPAQADPGLLADLVYGPIWYRILVGHAPLDRRFADALVDGVLGAAQGHACAKA